MMYRSTCGMLSVANIYFRDGVFFVVGVYKQTWMFTMHTLFCNCDTCNTGWHRYRVAQIKLAHVLCER